MLDRATLGRGTRHCLAMAMLLQRLMIAGVPGDRVRLDVP